MHPPRQPLDTMAMPFEDPSVSHGGKAMDVNQLMNNVALGDVNPVTGGSWLASSDKVGSLWSLH
jgi:hypothetical protein